MLQMRPRYKLHSNNHYLFFCPFLDIPGYNINSNASDSHSVFHVLWGTLSSPQFNILGHLGTELNTAEAF